jgi:YD repeat-containing protein
VTITNGGSGYTSLPTISFSGGGGSGASATAVLTPTSVANLTITSNGSDYTSVPTVNISGGSGRGATATATITPITQTLTWDVENRLISVTQNSTTTTFVYDGDGNRVKKTEGGQTTLYANKYYEKNLTIGIVTSNYYLGNRLIAEMAGSTLT